jgi:glycosyltransferase involved in cell wall biosynthesis
MKVGYLTASVSRPAGGLATSIRQEAIALRRHGGDIQVFAVEDSDSAKDLSEWNPIPVHLTPGAGPARFSYASGLGAKLAEAKLDLLSSHGLWRYTSVIASRWHARTQRPYIVSPHGMLDRWAIRNSALKKRIASLIFENRHLHEARCIRVLCDAEVEAVREFGLANPVAVIPNGIDPPPASFEAGPPPWDRVPGFSGAKVALSLGRLHPKKNLISLLQAWRSLIDSGHPEASEWRLVIAGLDEVGHETQLKRCAEELRLAESVWFAGPLFATAKDSAYRAASAFIIPSLSEGLPMVVLEAWSYGLPVVMTAACNLTEGFRAGAAFQVGPDTASISEGLQALAATTNAELKAMGDRGKALTGEKFSWERIGGEMASLLAWAGGQGPRPEHLMSK